MAGEMNGSDTHDAVVTEARNLGWAPKEEWRGDPERWVDANTFVQRGHEMMPLLKANNKRLVGQVESQAAEIAELRRQHKESLEAIEDLKKVSAELTATRVKETKAEILSKLREAKEAGNADLEVELTDQLVDLRAQEKLAKEAPKPAPAPAAEAKPGVDPVFTAWAAEPENSWFGTDRRKTALAIEIARELREDPKNAKVLGTAFFDLVAEETAKAMGQAEPARGASKVEGSRGGSGGSGGSGPRAKSYNDLPPDAKAACDKQGRQFVGKSGFKTEADWRSYYCTHYFAGEE